MAGNEANLLHTLQAGEILRVEYPQVYVDNPLPPPSDDYAVLWATDIHVGRASTYPASGPGPILNHITSLPNIDAAIFTGDIVEFGTAAEFADYGPMIAGAAMPIYHLPGNHDEPLTYSDPPPNIYTHYDAAGYPRQWSFALGGYQFIGFTSHLKRDEPYNGFAWIDQDTRDFITAEIANLNGRTPLLFSHFPLDNGHGNNIRDWWNWDGGQAFLYGALGSSGRYFSGHRHIGMIQRGIDLQGSCLAYNSGGHVPGYMIIRSAAGVLTVERWHGREPFELLETMAL